LPRTLTHLRGPSWSAFLKIVHAAAQASHVKLADGERPVAALCAAFAANQPLAALARSFSQSGIHDLDQLLIGAGQGSGHA
jgi:hypothetical protein